MADYEVRLKSSAKRDLARMDRQNAVRITERLNWLASNFDEIEPEALTSGFAGLFKFRVGDYRVIYSVVASSRILVVQSIGHRRDVYRNR